MSKVFRIFSALLLASGAIAAPAALAATCTVPNTISNGQVADASKLMDNFVAVANCVNTAPAGLANSIQYNTGSGFGAIAPLTNGQLLIGSTGAPPVPSSLTAGAGITITNAPGSITISNTVAITPGLYDVSVGVPTSFTNVNIGGNSSVVTNGAKAITISTAGSPPSSGPELYGVSIPVPTTAPYMIAVLPVVNFSPVQFSGSAVGFLDSTTGKLTTLVTFNGSAFGFAGYSFEHWDSATSRNSLSEPSTPRGTAYGPAWIGIKDDGTTISFLISYDGANFYPLGFSETKSGGFLSSYDHIFIGMFSYGGSGSDGVSANSNLSVSYLAYDPNGLLRTVGH